MEDLKKKINFDRGLLYYSTPNEGNDGTSKGSGLNVQETYNSSNRKHICVICGKRFFTQNFLKTHMEHHPTDEPVKANLEKDDNAAWKNRFVRNKGISCVKTNCNFIALDSVDYSKHTACCEGIRFTKENSSSYCELCDCYYSSENYFKAHCVLQHPENGPNISLKDDDQMNTKISDPVSLYVSEKNFENERSSLISAAPLMYPDSVVTKKKLKSFDMEPSTINMERTSIETNNRDDSNFFVEPSVSEAVEILKTALAADSQIMNERSTEIYSETESPTFEKLVDDTLINFEEFTEIQDKPTDDVEKLVTKVNSEISSEIRDTDNVPKEQLPVENNSDEISSEIRDTDNVLKEKLPIENNSEVSSEIQDTYNVHEKQLPIEFNTEQVSAEIQNSENVSEKQLLEENKVDVRTTFIAGHNFTDISNFENNLPKLEPMETASSEVHHNDEMHDHVGLQVLSEICETLSSKNLLMMDSRPKSVNQDISCDNQSELRDENGMKLSTVQTDATVQGNHVNVCSRTERTEMNSLVDVKPLINYSNQILSAPTTSEYHVLLAAAATLGDELLSMSDTSGYVELNPTTVSEQSETIEQNISQLKSAVTSTKRKYVKKADRNRVKKMTKTRPADSKNESDSDDDLDSKQQEKLAVLAGSNLIPTKANSKSYQKVGKYLKTMKPKENRSKAKSSTKRKHESESVDSDNLNVKQRSVRQRKKLILPDFEYSLENKAEFSDSSTQSANENSYSMGDGEPVKKRGRPRKKREDESKTSDIVKKGPSAVTNKKNYVPSASKKYFKSSPEIDDQSDEFSLNETVEETESESHFDDSYAADVSLNDSKLEQIIQEEDDDPNDEIHSWLKKVDFSEQTSFTSSWVENPPKKKLGRPRKKKRNVDKWKNKLKTLPPKVETTPKIPNVCNGESNQVIIKKKKGRPSIKDKSMEIQQPIKTETVVKKNIKVEKNDETSPTGVSPKKRGRPCKVKVDDKKDSDSVQSRDVTPAAKAPVVKAAEPVVTNLKSNDKVKTITPAKSNVSAASKTEKVTKPESASSQKSDEPSKKVIAEPSKKVIVEPSKKVIVDNADDLSALPETSSCSPDHVTPSATVTDLPKTDQKNLPKSANLSKTADLPKIADLPKTAGPLNTDNLPKTADLPNTVDVPETDDPLNTTELTNISPSDSSFVSAVPKKRGRPLKKKRLLLERRELKTATHDRPPRFSSTNENEDSTSEMDILIDVKQEDLSDETYQEPSRPKPTLWRKKNVTQRVKVAPEKPVPDETQQIDEALYHTDLRNKSKYSKVFKKVLVTTEESQNPDELVVCGRCQKKMTKRHYYRYHRISHYYLCWLEDEAEIDLNDDFEISRILQSMVNPDALRKKAIRLACERCDKVMKSVVGYVSHVRFCQKQDENELLEKCQLCPRALKPSSIRHHYIKFHGVTKFAPTTDSKLIPLAYTDTKKYTIVNQSAQNEELIPMTVKNMVLGYERTAVEKVDILSDDHFWKSLKTSYDLYMCMGLNCRHMTLGKDDLKSHILSCSASFCEFTCLSCTYMTKYESEIIYHRKKNCKAASDSEDNVEEKAVDHDRRTSTRVKKRKFFYGYDDDDIDPKANAGPKVDAGVSLDVDADADVSPDVDDDDDRDFVVQPVKRKKKAEEEDFVPSEVTSSEDSDDFDENSANPEENDGCRTKLRDRSKRRKADILLNKTFEASGLRNAFLNHSSTRYFDPLSSTVEARLETFATSPTLMNLRVDINEWETFPISDFLKYSPIQHKSPKVSFDGSPFVQLKVFDSDLIKGVPVCNTGGPVWSLAWAPLPAQVTEQYLAVAGLQHMNHVVHVETAVEFASIVQIWKYGSLDNISNDIHAPTLAWAIAHNYGAVWGMEWCPSGGFDNSSTPCRLGILALATSSGCCVVYSMPRLDCGGETRSIVANPEPDLILKVRIDDVQCTRIVWKRNSPPDTIYGGFSDGTIALWNVTSTSSILKKGKTLYPYRTFQAHNAGITALDVHWLDNCRFMVTSSSDRLLKFWDLEDLSGPMYEHEQANINISGAWMHHWAIAAVGSDYLNSVEPTAFICSPRELAEKKRPILNIKDTFWSVAYSDWNDAVAASSNGGCVIVYAAKHLSALTFKQPAFEKIITQTLVEPLSEEDKIKSESVEADTGLPPTNDSYDCSSLVQNYGIKFCDRLKTKPNPETLNFTVDKGNIKSVNKICWNQNYNSFNWLALGYDCGFVRVIRVERFDKSHLTKFYKLHENSTITSV